MDRVKYESTTTGTGNLTMTVVSGFQALSAAENTYQTNTKVLYTILDGNGTDWETGYGDITGLTLTRSNVFQSTNAGSAVSLSAGTHTILINRGFYEGHVITSSYDISAAGTMAFSSASTNISFSGIGENSDSSPIEGSDVCPGRSGDTVSGIVSNPKNEIPYCRGYRLHLRMQCNTTQAGEYFGIAIDPSGFNSPVAAAWGPCTSGNWISCSTPVLENKNPFSDGTTEYIDDQDSVAYKAYNTSGVSVTMTPQLYIEWLL